MVTTIFDKLKQLDSTMETMSQYHHTGEDVDELLAEPLMRTMESRGELYAVVNFILERLRKKDPDSTEYTTALASLTGLLEYCRSEKFFVSHSVTVEFYHEFETSKTYTIIVRSTMNNQVLTMTHVSLA